MPSSPLQHLEIATFTPHSALTAINHGAHRIELCAGPYSLGGLTPSISDLALLRSLLPRTPTNTTTSPSQRPPPPIFTMIRPRPTDFSIPYTPSELKAMIHSIHSLKAAGADGFVFGVLRPSTTSASNPPTQQSPSREATPAPQMSIDVPRTQQLVQAAHPLPCTFHRAFDCCLPLPCSPNSDSDSDSYLQSPLMLLRQVVEDVVATGCRAVLTSGGEEGVSRPGNMERVAEIVGLAEGRAEVIVGGGVRSGGLGGLVERLGGGVRWWHSSARREGGEGEKVDGGEVERMVRILGES